MRKYGESKTTGIMMATVPHVTAWAGLTKYQADGFLLDGVYNFDIAKCIKNAAVSSVYQSTAQNGQVPNAFTAKGTVGCYYEISYLLTYLLHGAESFLRR